MIKRYYKILKRYSNFRLWSKNISWRFPSTTSDVNTVFIVGSPRSGTTLLQRILSVHSQFFSINGETGIFSYQNIFDPKKKHFGLSKSQIKTLINESTDIVDFFGKGVSFLSVKNVGKRFVEKTPQHVLRVPFIVKHFPASKVIHIVRDGRDCYCSSKSNPWIPQNKSVATFAKYWKKCVTTPIPYENNERVMTVKYEELVCEPHLQIQEIMRFLGCLIEEAQLDPANLGNDKRASRSEFRQLHEPINTFSVRRYQTELTVTEIATFERIAGKELAYYDYRLTEDPN